jgi:tetratricopeptide (TPR) repeat protein
VLLKFLTDHQRFAEAYAIAEMCAKKTPSDANLLVNEGILASQLGHPDIALSKWKQAVASDASQTQAELYIAQELQREGKVAAAVPYYVTYLNKVSAGGVSKRPTPANIITVVLQLAECQAHIHNISGAEGSYALAESVARSNNEKKLESFAEVSHAALAADQSDMKNALRLYQSALNLDAEVDDRRGEATDWYNYAMFLKKAGYPARLVYASLTKSEETASGQTNDNDQVLQIASARQDEAIFLSKGDASVQSHPQTAIAEALTIAPK